MSANYTVTRLSRHPNLIQNSHAYKGVRISNTLIASTLFPGRCSYIPSVSVVIGYVASHCGHTVTRIVEARHTAL